MLYNAFGEGVNVGANVNVGIRDEKWISYDSITRLDPGEQPKPTPKPAICGKRVMLYVWWNMKVLVHFEVLDLVQAITSELYAQQLSRLDQAIRRQGVQIQKYIFSRQCTTTRRENRLAKNRGIGLESSISFAL